MRTAFSLSAAVAVVALTAASGLADNPPAVVTPGNPAAVTTAAAVAPASYAPLGMGVTVIGIGIGLGLIGYAALSGMARQPEQSGDIRTTMLIIGGLVEGAGIISLILCLVAR